jgi:hypothetical protein
VELLTTVNAGNTKRDTIDKSKVGLGKKYWREKKSNGEKKNWTNFDFASA